MYELNTHKDDKGHLLRYSVDKISVLRIEGSQLVAADSTGRQFRGDLGDYFKTEEEAWASARAELEDQVRDCLENVQELLAANDARIKVLRSMV